MEGGAAMEKWIDVVTDPLGLAGFALFLVFSVLAARRWGTQDAGLRAVFALLAIATVAGGLGLAYVRETAKTPAATTATGGGGTTVIQDTRCATGSPAISNVQGGVTVEINTQGAGTASDACK
jgi:hypothetical protein